MTAPVAPAVALPEAVDCAVAVYVAATLRAHAVNEAGDYAMTETLRRAVAVQEDALAALRAAIAAALAAERAAGRAETLAEVDAACERLVDDAWNRSLSAYRHGDVWTAYSSVDGATPYADAPTPTAAILSAAVAVAATTEADDGPR